MTTNQSVSNDRIARILNGLLVVTFSLLAIWDFRVIWLVLFMGCSLIFSGAANYCGFAKIAAAIRGPK